MVLGPEHWTECGLLASHYYLDGIYTRACCDEHDTKYGLSLGKVSIEEYLTAQIVNS
jgi:hypothetical protein